MRVKIIGIVGMVSVGLLATGCGGSESKSAKPEPSISQLPNKLDRPAPKPEGELQPSPAAGAPFAANLEYELRQKTLTLANATGEVTAKCPTDVGSKKGTTVVCTSTYKGAEVEWDVAIGDKPGWSENYVEFTATPRKGIISKEGVQRIIFGNGGDSLDHIRCTDIPEAVAVPMGPTWYMCQQVMKDGQVYYPQSMRATEDGPRAY
ncbi:hypothetical protein [Streptomyces chryseus]|uniref:hypothetical protein n=1 Tax=Streptomyces chryseus TaxID=68186 RepID=UPI00110FCE92|nr:hypothetical protein [Streptomyces chryseus]